MYCTLNVRASHHLYILRRSGSPFYLIALGVPAFGAVSAWLLGDYGGSLTLTLANYRALFHEAGQIGPLERSLIYAPRAGAGRAVNRPQAVMAPTMLDA